MFQNYPSKNTQEKIPILKTQDKTAKQKIPNWKNLLKKPMLRFGQNSAKQK